MGGEHGWQGALRPVLPGGRAPGHDAYFLACAD
jgi:hypothetical protein